MGKPSANPVCHIISFRVTRDEKDAIEALAKRQRLSVSQYLRGSLYAVFANELLAHLAQDAPRTPTESCAVDSPAQPTRRFAASSGH